MAYFKDFSEYIYHASSVRPRTFNIGWLDSEHEFRKASPDTTLLDSLWEYCKVSVVQMRGIHECELCGVPHRTVLASRKGEARRLLGSAEIRVFNEHEGLFAAPNLIYHYVRAHQYSPPDEFVLALKAGPSPSSSEHLDRLKALELDVGNTPLLSGIQRPTHYDQD